MELTREQARQIFMAGAMWEQGTTDQNFNDTWDVLSRKMSKSKSQESDSLPCVRLSFLALAFFEKNVYRCKQNKFFCVYLYTSNLKTQNYEKVLHQIISNR